MTQPGVAKASTDGRGGRCTATLTATAAHNPIHARTSPDGFRRSETPTDRPGPAGSYLQAGGRKFEPCRAHLVSWLLVHLS